MKQAREGQREEERVKENNNSSTGGLVVKAAAGVEPAASIDISCYGDRIKMWLSEFQSPTNTKVCTSTLMTTIDSLTGHIGCREFRGTMFRNCAGNFKHLRPKFKNHRRVFQEAGKKSGN